MFYKSCLLPPPLHGFDNIYDIHVFQPVLSFYQITVIFKFKVRVRQSTKSEQTLDAFFQTCFMKKFKRSLKFRSYPHNPCRFFLVAISGLLSQSSGHKIRIFFMDVVFLLKIFCFWGAAIN